MTLPFGAAGDLVYSLAGVNCYESYDWMPLPTDLKAEATDNGILLKWCAPKDAPITQYDLMNLLPGNNPILWKDYCMSHGLDPDTARHDPKIHFCVERSEDGGVTWSPYPYRGFSGEDSDNNQYLDKEVYLGKTYTYRISASQYIIFEYYTDGMIAYEDVTYTSGTTAPVSVTCDVAPTVITAADCTVVIPRDGNHPVRTVATAADAPYTADFVSWREAGATDNMKDEDVFVAGKVYDVRVDYKAKPGYVFSETTKLTVNGKPALGPFNSLTYCGLQFTAERKADISPSVSLTGWTYGGTRNSPVVSGNPGNAEVIFYSKAKGADDSTYIAALPENAGNYTLKALVDATDDYYGGTATCDFTIAKADGPAAPAGLTGVGPTSVNGTDGKITGVSAEMEYSSADSFASATSCTGNEITGLTAGTYYVRIRENMNYRAGGAATVTVPAYTPCTVTFDANGHGTAPAAQTVASGSKAEKPSDLTEAGWVFGGWYQETACTNAYDFETPVTADITVYAKWTKITTPPTTTYTIIAGANGEWTKGSTTGLAFTSGAPFDKFDSVKVDGSTIAAANYTAEAGSTKITLAPAYLETLSVGSHSIVVVSTDGTASTNFTVKSAEQPPVVPTNYTVTFNMNGHGSQVTAQTVKEGEKAAKPADPTASGYIFGGWYADATFSTKFDFNTAITANTTVYAKWTKNSAAPADPTSPQTGDNSNMFLWIALLLVSGGALVGTTVYGKKGKRAE